jgi:hypothetical protein
MNEKKTVENIEELDFSKYRTTKLADLLINLLSLPRSLLKLVGIVFVCVLIAISVIYLSLKIDNQSGLPLLLTEAYGIPASIVFGVSLWVVLFIKRSFSSLTQIVDLLLATTVKVVEDYQQLNEGAAKLPPMEKLVGAVYAHVFMPVFRRVF